MRVGGGGGELAGPRFRGGGEAAMARRRGAAVAEGEGGGCSASSTSSGRGSSSRGESPLSSFVRRGGRLGTTTDLEPSDGLPTSSSSYASAASTEPQDEEEDGALERPKDDERWVHVRRPQQPIKKGAHRSSGEGNNVLELGDGTPLVAHDQRSFVNGLIECQGQWRRQEATLLHGRKDRTHRPASLDFGCPGVARPSTHSPGFSVIGVGVLNKELGSTSHNRSDVLSSPGTPNYRQRPTAAVGYHNQQGCNSERVLPVSNGNRRHPGSSTVLPYNSSGRTLPSKWEDAERWIFSPNPSNAPGRPVLPHWRPKSKSGPLGPLGRFNGPYSSVLSSTPILDSGRVVGNFTVNSPFMAGVLLPEHVCGGSMHTGRDLRVVSGEDSSNGRGGRSGQVNGGHPATRSTRDSQQFGAAIESYQALHTSHESVQDGQIEITKDSTASNTAIVVRKNMATQTSPDISRSSSPSMRPSISRSLSVQQVKELESCFSKLEVRDVQIDDRVTLTRWSKKQVTRGSEKNSTNIIEWKKKTVESKSSSWEVTESAKCIPHIEGEQAKLTAWENMQKTKAEAAIQKLVIKLEKKRPYSLERIFSTLRSGHRKTQVVRSTETANHDQHISRTINTTSHLSKNGQMSSLSGCFTCHAF